VDDVIPVATRTPKEEVELLSNAIAKVRSALAEQVANDPKGIENAFTATLVAAIVDLEVILEVAEHSQSLVNLTRALLATTVVLAGLTAILILRTFL
jgi:hypothetical protein